MRFWKQLSSFRKTAVLVLFAHVCAIFFLAVFQGRNFSLKSTRPIVIRTVTIPSPAKVVSVSPVKQTTVAGKKNNSPQSKEKKPSAIASSKKTAVTQVAKETKTAVGKGKEVRSTAPKNKDVKSAPVEEKAIQWAASEEKEMKRRPELTIPVKREVQSSVKEAKRPSYGEFLIGYFEQSLDLPEQGEVKAQLEIDQLGRLVHCSILETQSVKNAEFLKNRLQELSFPCLNDFDILETVHTFTITFRNAEVR